MTDNNNSNLSVTYLNLLSDSLSVLRDSVLDAFAPIATSQITQSAIDILSDTAIQLAHTLARSVLENIDCEVINTALKDISLSVSSYVSSSLADNISVKNDCVIIEEDAVECICNFFDENCATAVPEITSKMSTKDFVLYVLIPLIFMVVPMLQNSYYHKLDTIESQRYQLQEAEYQETILSLETLHTKELEELNSNLSELLQYLESAQESDSLDTVVPSLPPDAQYTSPVPPAGEVGTADGVDDH